MTSEMFARDWDEPDEHDDHLPLEERGWFRRLMERARRGEELESECPNLIGVMGRNIALAQNEVFLELVKKEITNGTA